MENTVKVQDIFKILKKRIGFIITITVGVLLLSAIITFFLLVPKYEASTQILVNQSQNGAQEEITSTDLQSSRELISTYNIILTSPAILEPTIEESNFEGSIEELRSKINVSAEEESQVATVTVEDTEPETAVNLVNTLAQTFEQQIPQIMEVDNVSILSEAQLSDSNTPVFPQPALNLAGGLVIGLLIGVGLAFFLEYLDKTLKSEQDVERELGLPILGIVPVMSSQDVKANSLNNKVSESRSDSKESKRKTS